MHLFHWTWSKALQRYAPGNIIVMAANIQQAREKVMAVIDQFIFEEDYWMFESKDQLDETDILEFAEKRARFEEDLSIKPITVMDGVILLKGSE